MMEILGVFSERPGIIEAAKKEAEPYLEKDPYKAWMNFVKVMRDGGQNDIIMAMGTVEFTLKLAKASVTAEQVKELINGFK